MCGIVGFSRFKHSKKRADFTSESLSEALEQCSTRGVDATGFWTPDLGVVKDGIPAKSFIVAHQDKLRVATSSDIFIGHCRAATFGAFGKAAPAANNNNNHPFEGKRYVLVHNGMIRNAPAVIDYEYQGTCDSEIILSYIETFGVADGIRCLAKLDSFSLVIADKSDGTIYFYREANPLVYAIDFRTNSLIFGSTVDIVEELASTKQMHGIVFKDASTFYSTTANYLYKLDQDRLEKIKEIPLRLYQDKFDGPSWPKEIVNKLNIKSWKEESEKVISDVRVVRANSYGAAYGDQKGYSRGTNWSTQNASVRQVGTSNRTISDMQQEIRKVARNRVYTRITKFGDVEFSKPVLSTPISSGARIVPAYEIFNLGGD